MVETASFGREKSRKTLYERPQGIYAIASVFDDFIDLLYVNDVLNANQAIKETRDRVPLPGLKYRVTSLVCQATGGLCTCTGRSMKEAHQHVNITKSEWQAILADF